MGQESNRVHYQTKEIRVILSIHFTFVGTKVTTSLTLLPSAHALASEFLVDRSHTPETDETCLYVFYHSEGPQDMMAFTPNSPHLGFSSLGSLHQIYQTSEVTLTHRSPQITNKTWSLICQEGGYIF